METKDFITAFFAETLKQQPDSVASLYNEDGTLKDDAPAIAAKWHSDHLAGVRQKDQLTFDNGYKKANGEIAKRKDKAVAEAVGLDASLQGDELIEALKQAFAVKPAAGAEITEDVIKSHPVFKKRERELTAKLQEVEAEWKGKVEASEKEAAKKETLSKVYQKAAKLAREKGIVLSADEEKAKKQITKFVLDPLNGYDFEFEGEEIVGITKDGKRLEDPNGNPKTFEALVYEVADSNGADFNTKSSKQSPNGNGQTKLDKAGNPIVLPKTEEEYAKVISDPKTPPADRMKIKEAWDAAKTKTA